jgi:spore maturation protein CgeB
MQALNSSQNSKDLESSEECRCFIMSDTSDQRDSLVTIAQKRFEIARVIETESLLNQMPHYRDWKKQPHAICYYGSTAYSANVRIFGLAQAAQDWKIPFAILMHGQEEMLRALHRNYPNLLLIVSNPERLPYIESIAQSPDTRLIIFGRYINEGPSTDLYTATMCESEKTALKKYAPNIDLAISELSLEGNAYLLRSYTMEMGIPVMSFPWGVNLACHAPIPIQSERHLVFIGAFSEKGSRIKEFWTEPLKRFSQLLIGPDWTKSPFTNTHNSMLSTQEFNQQAPSLYSSSAIALNLHHAFEVDGFTCNERVFNAPACGGFVVSDRVRRIHDFFSSDELVVADNPRDYLEVIEYFVQYPERRYPYHTYHHRLADLLAVVFSGRPLSSFCPVMDFVQF